MNRSVCWCLTSRCNEGCKFCYRLDNYKELSLEDNLYILEKLNQLSIKEITFTGGEALLYPHILELMKKTHEYGMKTKLITNGRMLSNDLIDRINGLLDELTLSFDAIDDDIHNEMGRGIEHGKNVIRILDYIKENEINIEVKINTVVSRINSDEISKIARFLSNYTIKRWKLFKFQSLRGNSIHYENMLEISNQKFNEIIEKLKEMNINTKIVTRNTEEIEKLYLNISPNGEFLITNDYIDKRICDFKNIELEKIREVLKVNNELL